MTELHFQQDVGTGERYMVIRFGTEDLRPSKGGKQEIVYLEETLEQLLDCYIKSFHTGELLVHPKSLYRKLGALRDE